MNKKAVFAGGCFWCTQSAFDNVKGIISSTSGYIGGKTEAPTYEEVCSGASGHFEALEVVYDDAIISYDKVLKVFWTGIDPTDAGGQFYDRGFQYGTAIFYYSEDQKLAAENSKQMVEKFLATKVATKILPISKFYPAEEYHQNYHIKNTNAYKNYYVCSGRPNRLKEIWAGF